MPNPVDSAVISAAADAARLLDDGWKDAVFVGIPLALWETAEMFVVPLVLIENRGFTAALKRSAELVRNNLKATAGVDVMRSIALGFDRRAVCLREEPFLVCQQARAIQASLNDSVHIGQ